ncbi:hypothetical protein LCGC14_2226680 [marine sediment metagenome]|uniref:Uncharacterized protein n=1 Tax=marine sediment metagenome TaxID=412755 RepID=A0A0F9DX17_9ZZZZ
MIKLTRQIPFEDSTELWVNLDKTESFFPFNTGSRIVFSEEDIVDVTETPEEIADAIWTYKIKLALTANSIVEDAK